MDRLPAASIRFVSYLPFKEAPDERTKQTPDREHDGPRLADSGLEGQEEYEGPDACGLDRTQQDTPPGCSGISSFQQAHDPLIPGVPRFAASQARLRHYPRRTPQTASDVVCGRVFVLIAIMVRRSQFADKRGDAFQENFPKFSPRCVLRCYTAGEWRIMNAGRSTRLASGWRRWMNRIARAWWSSWS